MTLMNNILVSTFRRSRTIFSNRSPFSGKTQVVGLSDWQWRANFQYRPLTKAEGAVKLAAIAALAEGTGTVNLGDPDFRVLLSGYAGSLTVSGAGQTGQSLVVAGSANTLILKAGDYIELPTTQRQLFKVTADATTNGSGIATLALDAPLRTSPANAAAITKTNTTVPFRVTNYSHSSDGAGWLSLSIEAEEAL